MAKITTTVKNISGRKMSFGFLPPHGRELDDQETVTILGDLNAQLTTGGGRAHIRKKKAFANAETLSLIETTVIYDG